VARKKRKRLYKLVKLIIANTGINIIELDLCKRNW